MNTSALHAYAAARELHETRANHLAIVERDIAAFWAEGQQDPSLPFRDADARTTRIARLMAERGAVIVVERQAYEGLVASIERLVVALPVATVRERAEALLDGWPEQRDDLERMDAGNATIDTAHRAVIGAVCDLLDPLVAQGSVFPA